MEKFVLRMKKFIAVIAIFGMLIGGGYFVYKYTDIFKTTYTITLDGNGIEIDDNEIVVDKDGTITLPTPIRTGYTFNGWYLDGKKCEESIVITSDQTLQAKWTPLKYAITFLVDGVEDTAQFDYDSMPTFATPTKECSEVGYDYEFAGWEPSLKLVSGDSTYTATFNKVKEKRTLEIISNKSNAGVFSGIGSYDYDTVINISVTENKGYIFDGWYIDNTFYSSNKETTIQLLENTKVEARFVCDLASITYLNTKEAENSNPTLYTIEDDNIELQAISVKGYDFVGWYTGENGTGEKITTINASNFEDITLYAHFNIQTYTLSFEKDNDLAGTCSSDKLKYDYNSQAIITVTTNSGYYFIGWFIDKTLYSNEIETSILVDGNITIEAKFGYVPFTINYYNTKDATNPNPTSYTIENEYITLQNISANGYYFNGWYTDSTGGEKVTTINTSTLDTINLYAQFSLKQYEIKYTLNGGYISGSYPKNYTIESNTFTLKTPIKSGFDFIGWSTEADPTPKLEVTINKGTFGDLTFIANWVSNSLFNMNFVVDGKTLTNEKITQKAGTSIIAPTINSSDYGMTGYEIDGWYKDENCTQKYTFTTMPERDITVYGSWEYMLGNGFVDYLDEFESGDIEINSYYELVSLMEYIRFYAIQDKINFDITYTLATESLVYEAFLDSVFGGYCVYSLGSNYVDLSTPNDIININNTGEFLDADEDKSNISTQQEYAFAVENEIDRLSTNTNFNINNVKDTLKVTTSDQLVYALEKGFKPDCITGSPAEKMYSKAKSLLNSICDDDMTDIEKARAIYEWMILNIDYDHSALDVSDDWGKYDAWHLEGIFNNQKAVCDGIAKAMVVLCKIENIPIIRVTGSGHAWNKVYIDGVWYGIDATHGDVGLGSGMSALTYTSFLFTDSFKANEGYTTKTYDNASYIKIDCTTVFNFYDYFDITFGADTFDFEIGSDAELENLFEYFNSLNLTPTTYFITLEFTCDDNYLNMSSYISTALLNSGVSTKYNVYSASLNNTLGRTSYLILIMLK